MSPDVTLWAAFFAGTLSFLSPCVLPLVPPYLCFITGQSLEDLAGDAGDEKALRREVMLAALAFVLGFATVFTALGATASVVGQLLREHMLVLAQAAGVLIILMGLHFLGLFRFALLHRRVQYQHAVRPAGLVGAYAVGLAFAFGWTPCIGPVLAVILAVAASEQQAAQGAGLLAIYSAGLGVPFLLSALMVERFLSFLARFRRHLRNVERVTGALLVLTGIGFLTGAMQDMAYWLIENFPALARLG
jgi:cytochrome c-type biogenesis protein